MSIPISQNLRKVEDWRLLTLEWQASHVYSVPHIVLKFQVLPTKSDCTTFYNEKKYTRYLKSQFVFKMESYTYLHLSISVTECINCQSNKYPCSFGHHGHLSSRISMILST